MAESPSEPDFRKSASSSKEFDLAFKKQKSRESQPIVIVRTRRALPLEASRVTQAMDELLAELIRQVRNPQEK